jgi:hypothetical protein
MSSLSPEQAALEHQWLDFLVTDCLDLLEYDFWISPPEDLDPGEEIVFSPGDWNNGP